jgi:hypothetical protein
MGNCINEGMSSDAVQCEGKTKKGGACKNKVKKGRFCHIHAQKRELFWDQPHLQKVVPVVVAPAPKVVVPDAKSEPAGMDKRTVDKVVRKLKRKGMEKCIPVVKSVLREKKKKKKKKKTERVPETSPVKVPGGDDWPGDFPSVEVLMENPKVIDYEKEAFAANKIPDSWKGGVPLVYAPPEWYPQMNRDELPGRWKVGVPKKTQKKTVVVKTPKNPVVAIEEDWDDDFIYIAEPREKKPKDVSKAKWKQLNLEAKRAIARAGRAGGAKQLLVEPKMDVGEYENDVDWTDGVITKHPVMDELKEFLAEEMPSMKAKVVKKDDDGSVTTYGFVFNENEKLSLLPEDAAAQVLVVKRHGKVPGK